MNKEHGIMLTDLKEAARETATASTTMAAIAQAREERDRERAAADLEAQKARAEREAKAQERIATWFSENWRYLGLILLLVFFSAHDASILHPHLLMVTDHQLYEDVLF